MHASPSFQFSARHFGQIRAACSVLLVLSVLIWAAWAVQAVEVMPFAVAAGGVALVTCVVATERWMASWRPASLRWDGQRWFFGSEADRGNEALSGRLEACVDLGSWLLVRFEPDGLAFAGLVRRGVWLPLQRRGHELQWHALRSTVYCARPVFPPSAATPF